MWFAISVFVLSAVAIIALFSIKYWELRHPRQVTAVWRDRADERARELKDALMHSNRTLSKVPPMAAYISRYFVHEAALGMAAIARFSESQAHRLADFVSHKHRFERRETQSEFLKQVSERKTGIGGGTVQ